MTTYLPLLIETMHYTLLITVIIVLPIMLIVTLYYNVYPELIKIIMGLMHKLTNVEIDLYYM